MPFEYNDGVLYVDDYTQWMDNGRPKDDIKAIPFEHPLYWKDAIMEAARVVSEISKDASAVGFLPARDPLA